MRWAVIFLVLLALAGCDGDGGDVAVDPGDLPTRFAPPEVEQTPETEADPADLPTRFVPPEAEQTTEPEAEPTNAPPTAATQAGSSPVTAAAATEAAPALTQVGTVPQASPEATLNVALPPGVQVTPATPFVPNVVLSTPLVDVAVGDEVAVVGLMTIDGDRVLVDTDDETYSRVELDIALPVAQASQGRMVRAIGTISALPPDNALPVIVVTNISELVDNAAAVAPLIPEQPAPGGMASLSMPEDRSALALLDALQEAVGQSLTPLSISATIDSTWTIRAYDETDTLMLYSVQPTGIYTQVAVPGGPAGVDLPQPLDLSRVTLDVPDLAQLLAQEFPEQALSGTRVTLIVEDDLPTWTVTDMLGVPLLRVDAITGDRLQTQAPPGP